MAGGLFVLRSLTPPHSVRACVASRVPPWPRPAPRPAQSCQLDGTTRPRWGWGLGGVGSRLDGRGWDSWEVERTPNLNCRPLCFVPGERQGPGVLITVAHLGASVEVLLGGQDAPSRLCNPPARGQKARGLGGPGLSVSEDRARQGHRIGSLIGLAGGRSSAGLWWPCRAPPGPWVAPESPSGLTHGAPVPGRQTRLGGAPAAGASCLPGGRAPEGEGPWRLAHSAMGATG